MGKDRHHDLAYTLAYARLTAFERFVLRVFKNQAEDEVNSALVLQVVVDDP